MEFNEPFFAGGVYCLNFINTFDHRHTPPQYDFLPDRDALLEWGRVAGTVPKRSRAAAPSAGQPMARVHAARALIYRVLAPFVDSGAPSRADLSAFSGLLRETNGRMELVSDGGRYRLACSSDNPVDRILYEAVRSAAELLLSDRQDRIRECSECGWLFFDSTRNGSRRWCMMSICGNRAKARRHYQRIRRAKKLRQGKRHPTRTMADSQ